MRSMLTDFGHDGALHVITKLMIMADHLLGGDKDFDRCQGIAANVMTSNMHRSFGFIILAIREGMKRTDKDSRAYGKLNAQTVNVWLSHQEAAIMGVAEADHSRVVIKNDNWGTDTLNRMELDATIKDRKLASQGKEIDRLREQLGKK